jgi:hypothetical protein
MVVNKRSKSLRGISAKRDKQFFLRTIVIQMKKKVGPLQGPGFTVPLPRVCLKLRIKHPGLFKFASFGDMILS